MTTNNSSNDLPFAQQAVRLKRPARLQGLYLNFSERIDAAANKEIHALAKAIFEQAPKQLKIAITNIVPSYTKLYIEYDSSLIDEQTLRQFIDTLKRYSKAETSTKTVKLEVNYNGEDLEAIAEQKGLTVEDIIQIHSQNTYQVYALGFSAGFPFMGSVPEEIQMPRLATPRTLVPIHSVAMANAQTGIYATSSPGGWNILGHTIESVYDPNREQPFLLEAGDQVNFIPTPIASQHVASQHERPPDLQTRQLLPKEPKHPLFKVLKTGVLDIIVDAGRFMAGHYGLVRSGYLDTRSASIANKLLANPYNAPLLEMHYQGPTLEVLRDSVVAFFGFGMKVMLNGQDVEGGSSFKVSKGDTLTFPSTGEGKTAYLSVSDGFQSDSFLGSCSVDTKGALGQALQIDDILGTNSLKIKRAGFSFQPYQQHQKIVTLHIYSTDTEKNTTAIETLCANPFTVLQADRMGIRFSGDAVPGGELISEATQLGALQISPSGMPLLLLNDRGTLGGYSKPAVVMPEDLPKVAQLTSGQQVRFKEIN